MQAPESLSNTVLCSLFPRESKVTPLFLGPLAVVFTGALHLTGYDVGAWLALHNDLFAMLFSECGQTIILCDNVSSPVLELSYDVMLFMPTRHFAEHLTGKSQVTRSVGLQALRRYLLGLLALGPDRLSRRQCHLAVAAIRSLIAAAFSRDGGGLAERRQTSLIDRAAAHIEANLNDPLSPDSLCTALGCSRSALYRAAASTGGVSELIFDCRIRAVHEILRDPLNRQPIYEIARDSGFADLAQFNRRFKARFGQTPSEVRHLAHDVSRNARGEPALAEKATSAP